MAMIDTAQRAIARKDVHPVANNAPAAVSANVATEAKRPARSRVSEPLSYLERSTARLESKLPGANAAPIGVRAKPRLADTPQVIARQKPKKLYDQKAASLAKAVADRKAAPVEKKKLLSDNAKLGVALVLILAIGAGLYFSVPEVTRIAKVTVNGMSAVSEREIIDALLLSPEVNIVNADVPAMESRIMENPKIASASIVRAFPDGLVVNLSERAAVACVLVNEEIGTRSIAIDSEGVAFAYMDSIAPEKKLPVLSGIRFESFVPGQRLPDYLLPLLGDIAELSRDGQSPLDAFSEIKIEKISDSEAELLLYPTGRSVPVRMPARLTKASLGSVLLVLDILAGRQGTDTIDEIDFRTGTIVYRTKEAQPG